MFARFRRRWKNELKLILVFLVIFIPIFVVISIIIVSRINYRDSDFFTFWLAGRMNWTHQNPYMATQWIDGHHQFGAKWIPNPIFPYPLPLAFLLAPLGLFSLKQAFFIWTIISEIYIVFSVLLLITLTESQIRLHLVLPLIATSFLLRATLVTLINGQLGAFLLLILSLTVFMWSNQKWWQGGIILSLLIVKPTIGIPVVALLFLWLLTQKKVDTIIIIIVTSFAYLTIGLVRDLHWLSEFISIGNNKLFTTFGYSPTIWGASGAVCDHNLKCVLSIGSVLSIILTVIFLHVLLTHKIDDPALMVGLVIPISLSITPYIWAYDQIILIIPLSIITIRLMNQGYPYLLATLTPLTVSILSLVCLYLAFILGHDGWSVLLPLTCFALLCWTTIRKSENLKNTQTKNDL